VARAPGREGRWPLSANGSGSATRYAVVGHGEKRAFPKLTYNALKKRGKTVYAVDPGAETVEGDQAWPDFSSLPSPVDAAVLELPKEETAEWVGRAADAGIAEVWLHQMTDTPEALTAAKEHGLERHHRALRGDVQRARPQRARAAPLDLEAARQVLRRGRRKGRRGATRRAAPFAAAPLTSQRPLSGSCVLPRTPPHSVHV
jgi:uncharacterized protein